MDEAFEVEFYRLANQHWKETSYFSTFDRILDNDNYRKLLELGKRDPNSALVLAFLEMSKRICIIWHAYVNEICKGIGKKIPAMTGNNGKVESHCEHCLVWAQKENILLPEHKNELEFNYLLDKLYHKTWNLKEKAVKKTDEFQNALNCAKGIESTLQRKVGLCYNYKAPWVKMILKELK